MQSVVDAHNVTLVGAWNRRIFNLPWVAANLARGADVRLEVAVDNPTLPVRLTFGETRVRLGSDRLVVSSTVDTPDARNAVQDTVTSVLDLLPHTPVHAVGVNFRWRHGEPDHELLELFSVSDNAQLADAGAGIEATEIKRTMTYEECGLNLLLRLDEDKSVIFDFNFYRSVTSVVEARQFLAAGIEHFLANAGRLLNAVYTIDLEDQQ